MSHAKGTPIPSSLDWTDDLRSPRSRPSPTATIRADGAAHKVDVVPPELRRTMDDTLAGMRGLSGKAKALRDDIEAERAKLREFIEKIPN